ncbi:MAG TPA: NUDIX domain-containing protein [Phycisphaerales bacterium]|nr:NUDIX domain-containing protein [Phycisphaerales bacterium]
MLVQSDLVDVYVFRREPCVQFLQLLRTEAPMEATWHPVMGHVREGETALEAALRELSEETGLTRAEMLGFWALQEVSPYFIPPNTVKVSGRFAAEVGRLWQPTLNAEHHEHRWRNYSEVDRAFLWPGQRAACREVKTVIVAGHEAAKWQLV